MKQFSIFVISLLFLASCGQDNTEVTIPKKAPDMTHMQVSSPNGVKSYTEIIGGTTEKIKNTEEFQLCMNQQANMCIQAVGMDIAQKTRDMSFCKELGTPEQQASCEFAIMITNVQEKNDPTLCETLSGETYKEQCKMISYKQDATQKKDPSLCNKIDTLSTATGDTQKNTQYKNDCMMSVILGNPLSTLSDCDAITTPSVTDSCRSMVKSRPVTPPASDASN